MRRLVVLLLALLPLALTAPAHAKGATSVTVSGPGVDHVVLDYTRSRSDVDLGTLADASGFYGIFGAGRFVASPDLTATELGPRYELRWDAGEPMAVSYVYPFAEGGAWAEVPSDQRVWGVDLAGGWWHGGAALERQLVTLGAEPPAPAPKSTSPRTSASSPEPALEASSPQPDTGLGLATWWVPAVALLAGLAALTLRRRVGRNSG